MPDRKAPEKMFPVRTATPKTPSGVGGRTQINPRDDAEFLDFSGTMQSIDGDPVAYNDTMGLATAGYRGVAGRGISGLTAQQLNQIRLDEHERQMAPQRAAEQAAYLRGITAVGVRPSQRELDQYSAMTGRRGGSAESQVAYAAENMGNTALSVGERKRLRGIVDRADRISSETAARNERMQGQTSRGIPYNTVQGRMMVAEQTAALRERADQRQTELTKEVEGYKARLGAGTDDRKSTAELKKLRMSKTADLVKEMLKGSTRMTENGMETVAPWIPATREVRGRNGEVVTEPIPEKERLKQAQTMAKQIIDGAFGAEEPKKGIPATADGGMAIPPKILGILRKPAQQQTAEEVRLIQEWGKANGFPQYAGG